MSKAQRKSSSDATRLQEHWYLSFLGLIGIWKLPGLIESLSNSGSLWSLLDLLWLTWFAYVLPLEKKDTDNV